MGAGIAQLALEAGHEVVLHDVDEAAIAAGRDRIQVGLGRRAAKLDLDADSIDDWIDGRLARLRDGHSLDAVGAEADFVIEAALEDLDLKQTLFRTLDAAAADDVVLATNTSALSVAAIASATAHPERVLGLHFFNPAPVMRLVELVPHKGTARIAIDQAARLVTSWDRTVVRSTDTPGFIVNRVNRPFTLEALAILEAGEASVATIDGAMRADGFPMGPFELMDLVGIDVNLAAARGIFDGAVAVQDPLADRFRPSPTQERLVDEGSLGRKSGEGFYRYDATTGRPAPHLGADDASERITGPEVAERLRLAIAAEAYRALDEGVATAGEIDLAMRLGAGHPIGPIEWAETLGGREAVETRLAAMESLGPRFHLRRSRV